MKKWNEAEIVELNIAETAETWWEYIVNEVQKWATEQVYKAEEKYNYDFDGDTFIGDPNKYNSGSSEEKFPLS